MLHEGLGMADTDFRTTGGGILSRSFEVLIDSMMGAKPFPLALVTGEHRELLVNHITHVDVSGRRNPHPEVRILLIHRIAVVEVGNPSPRHARNEGDIGNRAGETGATGQQVNLLVVQHVVVARVCDHQRWPDSPEQVDRAVDTIAVIADMDIPQFQAVIRRPDPIRGNSSLFTPNGGNLLWREVRASAVSCGRGGDMNLPTEAGKVDQRAPALDLRVIWMSKEGQSGPIGMVRHDLSLG